MTWRMEAGRIVRRPVQEFQECLARLRKSVELGTGLSASASCPETMQCSWSGAAASQGAVTSIPVFLQKTLLTTITSVATVCHRFAHPFKEAFDQSSLTRAFSNPVTQILMRYESSFFFPVRIPIWGLSCLFCFVLFFP